MAASMTGFGRATVERDGRELTIELKSVNHRYLDIGMRLPRTLSFLEDTVRGVLSAKLARGHVDVFANYKNTRSDSKTVMVDEPLLRAYLNAVGQASQSTGILNDVTLSSALRFPDVLTVAEAEEDRDALCALCMEAAAFAADELAAMRAAEGEKLARDMNARADALLALVERIEERAPGVVVDYRDKLQARIAELLTGGAQVDDGRLAAEVAFFADKANITEELVRLRSHIAQFHRMLASSEAAGRKLDFIVQEMNREMNTIGSKAADLEILNAVIEGKGEIEKIREQVQNIE